MKRRTFIGLLALGVALAISLAFVGGWLVSDLVRATHPPGFSIVDDLSDEIPLIRFTQFDGLTLWGSFEGDQPRFLLGEGEEIVVPEADRTFQLDLKKIR